MKERNFEEFLSTVYVTAEEKSKKMIRDIDDAGRAALRTYSEEKKRASEEKSRREEARAAATGAADASRRAGEIRSSLFARREEIMREVFGEIDANLAAYTKTRAYKDALFADAETAAELICKHGGARLGVREADLGFADELSAKTGLSVVADSSIKLGGIRGVCDELECDLTLDTKRNAAKEKFMRESGLSVV